MTSMLLPEVKENYGTLPLYINGQFVESETSQHQDVMNPVKDEVIAKVPFATRDEVEEAVEAAVQTYERWKEVPIPTRMQYLYRMKYAVERRMEELSRIIVQNHGKPIDEARGEMRRLIENIETVTSMLYTLYKGQHMDNVAAGIDEALVRVSLGVFAIVGPFNFPVMAPFWFISHAITF